MKSNDKKQLHEKNVVELVEQASQLRRDIEKIAIERSSKKLHNTAIISKKKKELAQVLTAVRMKEILEP